jgi:DnaJ-class molecular chaperone
MRKPDPYEVLGVRRSASIDEIKRSYRRLARRFHPDLNPGNRASVSKFREAVRAYEKLSRRPALQRTVPRDTARGDDDSACGNGRIRTGHGSERSPARTGRGSFAGLSTGTEAFRFRWRESTGLGFRRTPLRGKDIRCDLTVDFRQALKGVTALVTVLGRTVEVRVPAGVDTGHSLTMHGYGAPGKRGGPSGDLIIDVHVAPHERFRREGDDIHLDLPITFSEAWLGAGLEIPGPDGLLRLVIPSGTLAGAKFRYRGKGFPSLTGARRGDFYVRTHLMIPGSAD